MSRRTTIREGQVWSSTWAGLEVVIDATPHSPKPLEVRIRPLGATFDFKDSQPMTRTWLRRYYELLP